MMLPIRDAFSGFLSLPKRLHFAAHSHHPWPDVSLQAHQQAWLDAATHIDNKWDVVLGEVLPTAHTHIARLLNLPDAGSLATAPNTHELLLRLLSCIASKPARILTTDSEFHSFSRQIQRLEEAGEVVVTRVATEPFDSFANRFAEAANHQAFDLIYVSQVFYNSGFAIADLDALLGAIQPSDAMVAIDGYHGFMARPTDLSAIADRVFYLAGGYKYAMAGEGACFMHCPPGVAMRPVNTGWYAGFGQLSGPPGGVQYTENGGRFLGATFDPTAWYRFNAVQALLEKRQISVSDIHAHVRSLQERFLAGLPDAGPLSEDQLIPSAGLARGNFLTFRTSNAGQIHQQLMDQHVITDFRGDRLRFGFGLYHGPTEIDALLERLQQLPAAAAST